jgi:hypothetical protein
LPPANEPSGSIANNAYIERWTVRCPGGLSGGKIHIAGKLYQMGFRGKIARSTLADANEACDWRIYADFAQILIAIARPLYALDPIGVDLDQSLYASDSTTIDLCLALFPWAKFRKHKAAVKMHTSLGLRGNIPVYPHYRGQSARRRHPGRDHA